MNTFLDPIREKRAYYEARPAEVRDALAKGTAAGKAIGQETMEMVRDALQINYLKGGSLEP